MSSTWRATIRMMQSRSSRHLPSHARPAARCTSTRAPHALSRRAASVMRATRRSRTRQCAGTASASATSRAHRAPRRVAPASSTMPSPSGQRVRVYVCVHVCVCPECGTQPFHECVVKRHATIRFPFGRCVCASGGRSLALREDFHICLEIPDRNDATRTGLPVGKH